MAYYLSKERNEDVSGSYRRYQQYLREHEDRFPPGAFALGTSLWWQLAHDHRCPHDGRLESFTVTEVRAVDGERITTIRTRLVAGYHDGYIELFYPHVFRYQLHGPSCVRGLGDWLCDEFTLSPDGHIIHEIEWRGVGDDEGSRWIIEASDIQFQWIPKPGAEATPAIASQLLYERARGLMADGSFELAAELFKESAVVSPHFKTYELLGECYMHLKRLHEAIPFLADATTLNRGVRAPSLLAEVWLTLGRHDKALEAADIALSRDPKNKAALRVRETAKPIVERSRGELSAHDDVA